MNSYPGPFHHRDVVRCLSFTRDQPYLISGSNDDLILVWDIRSGQAIQACIGHRHGINGVAVAPHANELYSCSVDQRVGKWRIGEREAAAWYDAKEYSSHTGIHSIDISPDGKYIAICGGWDIVILDSTSLELVAAKKRVDSWALSVKFTPDGEHLLSGGQNGLQIWSIPHLEQERVCLGHKDRITDVALNEDGTIAATSSLDQTVRTWNLSNGIETKCFTGHDNCVNGVRFWSHDLLLSVGDDHTLRAWSIASGNEVAIERLDSGAIETVAVSPALEVFATGGADCSVRIWQLQRTNDTVTMESRKLGGDPK